MQVWHSRYDCDTNTLVSRAFTTALPSFKPAACIYRHMFVERTVHTASRSKPQIHAF